jgi:aminopeptidase N
VPAGLAEARRARLADLKYDVTIDVPGARAEPVRGAVSAAFLLSDRSAPLFLDFAQSSDRLLSVSANGRAVDPRVENGHIPIPASALLEGMNTIELAFIAGDAPLNRQDDFLYSLFVPARASETFPCFDQPDLKARWTLTLNVPPGWAAVSNTRASGRVAAADRVSFIFDETPPLPTYLFAFAAGRFSEERSERNGRLFRMLHRESDPARVARNREAIFDQHAQALAWMEEYTGIPYPFGTFDFVLVPSFQFGGMEHPGAVYYNANALLLDESATEQQALARANVIAHETAHMWFGNLVTMPWFNDVWMKEVFANFMAAKIVNPSFPGMNHDLRFLLQHQPAAYDVDRTEGANPIRQPLDNLAEAGSLYGAIIYQKAPVVMRQLELVAGDTVFREGVREYLRAHAFGNAGWNEFVAEMDRRVPGDLRAWSRAWVEEAGRPTIHTDLTVASGVIERLAFRQEDPRGRSLTWPQRLNVVVQSGGRVHEFDVTLEGAETVVTAARGLRTPVWILPDGRGAAYGDFQVDPATLTYVAERLHALPDALHRGAALVLLWDAMLDGRVPAAQVIRQLTTSLGREADELNRQQMLDYLRAAFWRFTPPDDRHAAAAAIEPVLRAGLGRASTPGSKGAWFTALRSVALTTNTIEWLESVWRRTVTVPGLTLSEVDDADLAADLAVRDVAATPEILRTELERLTDPDRKGRFAFVTPALSPDSTERDRFFDSLADPAHRTREAWVLDAMRYLNHPLRAAQSRKYVQPALALVPEIRRTGDIFFPKRWADATLSGYQSVQTAAEVRAFIDRLPADYPPRLKWILLSAADPLFRAARLQQ